MFDPPHKASGLLGELPGCVSFRNGELGCLYQTGISKLHLHCNRHWLSVCNFAIVLSLNPTRISSPKLTMSGKDRQVWPLRSNQRTHTQFSFWCRNRPRSGVEVEVFFTRVRF